MRESPPIPVLSANKKRSGWLVLLGAFLCVVLVVALGVWWLKNQISRTGFTTDQTVQQVVIGNDVLDIPANLIRFDNQRGVATLEQADLAILWPSGDGYSADLKQEFQKTGPDQNLIFITLSKRKMQLDMTGRLEPIYLKLFDGASSSGPAGLAFQSLKAGTGYDGEQLAVFAGGNELWIARCQDETVPTRPTCLRDVFTGEGLSISYRFPVSLLSNWRKIEALVVSRVDQMLVR